MHKAVIAVAAGTTVAMVAMRQRAIRNAIAGMLTVRATSARMNEDGRAVGARRGDATSRWDVGIGFSRGMSCSECARVETTTRAETRDAGRDNILLALSARSAGRVWVSSAGREGRVRT